MLVLLPPSKTMRAEGHGPPWRPAGPLGMHREEVAAAYEALAQKDRRRFGRTVDASGELLDDAIDQAGALRTDPTAAAGERYTGQLHQASGYGELSPGERARYDRHVRIVSALLGLVTPDEMVPRYRLPMGTALPSLGRLAGFWRGPLGSELLRSAQDGVVWDLLSTEYSRAIGPGDELRTISVRFERPAAGDWRAAPAVIGKQLKGALARHLSLGVSTDDPDARGAAEGFSSQGYTYAGERAGRTPTVIYRSSR